MWDTCSIQRDVNGALLALPNNLSAFIALSLGIAYDNERPVNNIVRRDGLAGCINKGG